MTLDPCSLIRPEVRALAAYQAAVEPDPNRRAKLDANESPFALGESIRGAVTQELAAALRDVELHRYPDPEARELRRLLARELGVEPAELLVTNGSDEGIQLLLVAVAGPGVTVLSPAPTFVMYELGARALGLRYVGVPTDAEFLLDADTLCAAIRREQPRLVFLAWPNNPTGRLLPGPVVEAVLRACSGEATPALVVVDEAYFQYAGVSFLPRLREYPHLVVLRTLSKIGLAGIRLGMLVAQGPLIAEINKVRSPYNVNALSQAVGRVVLAHADLIRRNAERIVAERERMLAELRALPGVTVFPSQANFFLVRTDRPGDEVHQALLARGVLVRNFSHAPHLANCLRVTVGAAEENEAFLSALRAVLGAGR